MPSNKFAALINNLPRRHTSVLVQLRTGHIPLNHHLARIKKIGSPSCLGCGARSETVYHYLLICPAYRFARRLLEREVGRQCMRIEHLLTNEKSLPHLFRFRHRTKRLNHIFGSLTPPTRDQPDPPRVAESRSIESTRMQTNPPKPTYGDPLDAPVLSSRPCAVLIAKSCTCLPCSRRVCPASHVISYLPPTL